MTVQAVSGEVPACLFPELDPTWQTRQALGREEKLFGKSFILDIYLQNHQSQPLMINQDFLTFHTLFVFNYTREGGGAIAVFLLFKASNVFLLSYNHHVMRRRQRSS